MQPQWYAASSVRNSAWSTLLLSSVKVAAGSVAVVALAIVVLGLATGPLDIALFTVRQRRTDPAWFGRAFAVSMSVNYIGSPIGSALAGTLIGRSLDLALWAAVALALVAAVFPMLTIPAHEDARVPAT